MGHPGKKWQEHEQLREAPNQSRATLQAISWVARFRGRWQICSRSESWRQYMSTNHEKLNILLVDDQPSKLLSYEVMLEELNENLIKASSAREALEQLLKHEIAVILVDVCMPEQDGFELAAMIREHPRYQKIAIIFISAIHLAEVDHLRGYQMGAVDYMPVPVIPEVLRAKVKVFTELYRKSKQLEHLNA